MKFAKNTLRISLLLENSSRIFDQDDPPPPSTLFCIFLRMTNISGKIFSPSSCFATKSCKKTFSGFRKLLRRIGRPSSIPGLSKRSNLVIISLSIGTLEPIVIDQCFSWCLETDYHLPKIYWYDDYSYTNISADVYRALKHWPN